MASRCSRFCCVVWMFAISFASYGASSALFLTKAKDLQLHNRVQWQRFFYAENQRSLVLDPAFFENKNGGSDLEGELRDTVEALFQKAAPDKHVLCRHPARAKWLIKELQVPQENFAEVSCPENERFQKMVYPKSVWISFASYYLSTPASSYGHTLLRLSKSSGEESKRQNDLLDYSISLAANPDTDNPLLYALKGLWGGFYGTFSALPYYFKIREYNDYESRDLWSYQVDLSTEQVERLVDMIWELDRARFRYYYLTKNCSYFLLALLDGLSEDFHFVEGIPFYVIPIDTIRVFENKPGFIKKVDFRASSRSQFWASFEQLTDQEKSVYKDLDLQRGPEQIFGTETERTHILDTAITQFDYFYPKQMFASEGEMYKSKQAYLLARSKIRIPSQPLQVPAPPESDPRFGHSAKKFSLGLGAIGKNLGDSDSQNYLEMRMRYSFHELEDPTRGHFFSKLNMFDFQARAYTKNAPSLRLHKVTLFDLFSISPVNRFERKGSWKAEFSFNDFLEPQCFHCYGLRTAGAYGWAIEPWESQKPTLYALGGFRLDAAQSTPTRSSVRAQLGLNLQAGLWTHVFTSEDAFNAEFSRYFFAVRRADVDPWESEWVLRYSLTLNLDTQVHLEYEQRDILKAFAVKYSRFL